MGAERSKSYGRGDNVSDFQAMAYCITLAWKAYRDVHGGEGDCPIAFDAEGI